MVGNIGVGPLADTSEVMSVNVTLEDCDGPDKACGVLES